MENGPGEKFCLRWNEFEKNISTSLKHLYDDKDFFDVTLVCENNQIQAHKLILSACSPFFQSVLKQNPHQHPLLYLKGIRYEDITSVLDFMYHGEVSVAQEELNTFLAVAEDLKVKGLIQNQDEKKVDFRPRTLRKSLPQRVLKPSTPLPKQPRIRPSFETIRGRTDAVEVEDPLPAIKTEACAMVEVEEEDPSRMIVSNEYHMDNSGYEEYQQEYEEQSQYETAALSQQGRSTSAGWSNIPKPFHCEYCSKSFASKNALQQHTKSHTGQTYCDICDKNFSNVPNLRAHISSVHRN